jgi:hypothetical protein
MKAARPNKIRKKNKKNRIALGVQKLLALPEDDVSGPCRCCVASSWRVGVFPISLPDGFALLFATSSPDGRERAV